jgi:hypothetical protein
MSAVNNTPTNRNFLASSNFRMVLKRAPNVNFYLQSASIPGLTFMGSPIMDTPFVKIPLPGDHLNYLPLTVSFMVDEDMKNYMEMWNWMFNIAGPSTLDPSLINGMNNSIVLDPNTTIRSDIKLIILSSAKNPNMEVTFHDAFPVSLGDLTFNTTTSDLDYLQTSTTFDYIRYTIKYS